MMSTVVFASGRAWVRSAFPVSSAIVGASSSRRASSASAMRARRRPRSRGIVRDQAGKASAATLTARATSSAAPRGTSAIGRRCAGSSTSSISPEALSTHFPPINMRVFLSAASSVPIFVTAVMIASVVLPAACPAALRSHFVHDVVLARMLDHLQSEIVVRPDLGHWRMINLERFNPLSEIGGVSADVDYIANAQRRTRFKLHGHDREMAVIVGYDADALLRRSRLCRPRGRRPDCLRLCPLAGG